MMLNRTQQILAGVLLVQIILAVLVFLPQAGSASAKVPLLPEYSADKVTQFSLENSDGKQIQLSKQADAWVVSSADAYPADKTKVDDFLKKLADIKMDRLVASSVESHKQLEVASGKFASLVKLKLDGGKEYTLYIGSTTGTRATHVRLDGSDNVYLTGEVSGNEVSPSAGNWVSAEYFKVDTTTISALTLQNANGKFEFAKDATGAWSMKGLTPDQQFNQNTFTNIINSLGSISFNEPLGKSEKPEYGISTPAAHLSFTAGTQNYEFVVGQKLDDETYVLRGSNSEYYVKVSSYTVETYVNSKLEDFIVVPTAGPETSATPEGEAAAPTAETTPVGVEETPATEATLEVTATP